MAQRLGRLLTDELGHVPEPDVFRDETSLHGRGLGLDSVDVMALILRVEEEFGIFFDDGEIAESVKTMASLARAVTRKLREGGP